MSSVSACKVVAMGSDAQDVRSKTGDGTQSMCSEGMTIDVSRNLVRVELRWEPRLSSGPAPLLTAGLQQGIALGIRDERSVWTLDRGNETVDSARESRVRKAVPGRKLVQRAFASAQAFDSTMSVKCR